MYDSTPHGLFLLSAYLVAFFPLDVLSVLNSTDGESRASSTKAKKFLWVVPFHAVLSIREGLLYFKALACIWMVMKGGPGNY